MISFYLPEMKLDAIDRKKKENEFVERLMKILVACCIAFIIAGMIYMFFFAAS